MFIFIGCIYFTNNFNERFIKSIWKTWPKYNFELFAIVSDWKRIILKWILAQKPSTKSLCLYYEKTRCSSKWQIITFSFLKIFKKIKSSISIRNWVWCEETNFQALSPVLKLVIDFSNHIIGPKSSYSNI